MGTLYNRDGSIIAYYENGVVYDDATKCRTLGTYDNNGIYETSFIGTGSKVGYVSGGVIMSGYGGLNSTGIGRVSGRYIYSGSNSYNTSHIAYFMDDELGAAAAALLSGILTSNYQTNTEYLNNSTTYDNYTPSYGSTYDQGTSGGSESTHPIIYVILSLISIFVDIMLVKNAIDNDAVGKMVALFALIGFVAFNIAFIVLDSIEILLRYMYSILIGVGIAVGLHYLHFNSADPRQTAGGILTFLLAVLGNFFAIFLPSLISAFVISLIEDKNNS